ncbi:phage holin family protein [Streptococcus acidominimus]|uniref:Holin n=1 Tax=Streptococcus acidominimus TaxID=1326 RepID=A0A1Q8EF61_STRAI|nr:phage holin family protein [Streptococcus acidominimus]OLF50429.1 holin [Streptococcus acidominimus]SUN06353.1 phage holin [Streptococcus acidominimus]
MFLFLQNLIESQDGKIFYILGLIACAMIIDFFTGAIAAKINPDIDFVSKIGINGILRKLCSMIVMIFFVPVAILLPSETGIALLYVMYLGYLLFELTSILENLKKMGLEVRLFKDFLDVFKKK